MSEFHAGAHALSASKRSLPCLLHLSQVRKINGVDVYVGEPKEGGDKSKALLFLSDIFGLGLVNNKVGHFCSWSTRQGVRLTVTHNHLII